MRKAAVALLVLAVSTSAFAKAKITVRNNDAAGTGFNDPTPRTPVGGNPGTTLGAQRLNAFQKAADLWGDIINSDIPIIVDATMPDLPCDATSATLGQARPGSVVINFDNAPKSNVWYPVALASKLAGRDLNSGAAHIVAQFNAKVDSPACLSNGTIDENWYYGFDDNHGNDIDLITVVMHELGHGLGFTSGVDPSTGAFRSRLNGQAAPYVFDLNVLDIGTNLRWTAMSDAQRLTSVTSTGHVVWDGPSVKEAAKKTLEHPVVLNVTGSGNANGNYLIGNADFGPIPGRDIVTGKLVQTLPADACSALTNATLVRGQIAVVNRGNCTFVSKAKAAQDAGAIAVVILDNKTDQTCLAPGMTKADDPTVITIPTLSIGTNDANGLRNNLGASSNGGIITDNTFLAGADGNGNVRLYIPCTLQLGSSVSHWDTVASPNLLMEPSINGDLTHQPDLTTNELIDIGWTAASSPAQPPPPPPVPGRRILKRGH